MNIPFALTALALIVPLRAKAENNEAYRIFTAASSANWTTDVKADLAGNLYFCDWSARIFKMNAVTGKVVVVAGTGTWGFSGDGGPAIDAQLGGPGSLALDAFGNIYFADGYNYRVRKISAATGRIETVAGNGYAADTGGSGPALEAGIGSVQGVAVDVWGNLYLADGGARVLKVTASTGIITTLAGNGTTGNSGDGGPAIEAEVYQPTAVALDIQGNVYIAAYGSHRIRKVDAKTGIITTIAGNSTGQTSPFFGIVVYQGGFSGDGGPATEALLNDPEGVAVDLEGNVYISDGENFRIRKVDAKTGVIDTIAGDGIEGYTGDGGPAVAAEMTYPGGIAVDLLGRVYFADVENDSVRELVLRNTHGRLDAPPSLPAPVR